MKHHHKPRDVATKPPKLLMRVLYCQLWPLGGLVTAVPSVMHLLPGTNALFWVVPSLSDFANPAGICWAVCLEPQGEACFPLWSPRYSAFEFEVCLFKLGFLPPCLK